MILPLTIKAELRVLQDQQYPAYGTTILITEYLFTSLPPPNRSWLLVMMGGIKKSQSCLKLSHTTPSRLTYSLSGIYWDVTFTMYSPMSTSWSRYSRQWSNKILLKDRRLQKLWNSGSLSAIQYHCINEVGLYGDEKHSLFTRPTLTHYLSDVPASI